MRALALGAACVLLAGCWLSGCSSAKDESKASPTVAVQVTTVESKAIQRKVSADAVLYPLEQAAIVPKITAPVKKFYVNRGSAVHAGQLLAELESQDLSGQFFTENQGGYIQAQAGYDSAVQKAQQDLELAKQELDAAQKLYDSRQVLYKQGAVSAKDVDDASVSLTQAQKSIRRGAKAIRPQDCRGTTDCCEGKSASAEAALSYTKIVSPIDGVVTDRPFNPGETPPPGSALITVMNLSQVVARAHVSPQEAASMKVGDTATVSMPGVDGEVRGKVTLVSPALDPNSTTVEIWIQSPNPRGQLKPGASARLTVVAETKPRAVVAPAAALLTGGDGTTSVICSIPATSRISRM